MSSQGAIRNAGAENRPAASPVALRVWLGRHLQALFFSVGEMWRARASTALTVAVIGIALALPVALHIVVKNVARVGGELGDALQISLFLQPSVDEAAAGTLADRLRGRPGIAEVRVIGRSEALAEYALLSGLSDVQNLFGDDNPLPVVLVVTPAPNQASPPSLAALGEELQALAEVDALQSDLSWSQRLAAWTELARRLLTVAAVALGGGVVLVIGNMTRVAAQGRREEIVVARLCGATDSFIRRPFLYAGVLFGVTGSVFALLVVAAGLLWLAPSVGDLSALYGGGAGLEVPGAGEAAFLVSLGGVLGLAGAWIAVARLLASLEP